MVGVYDFDAILPLEGKVFLEEDWYSKTDCLDIEELIMEDSQNFASFMYQLVVKLIGTEDEIMEFLGFKSGETMQSKYDGLFLDDEDFND